MQYDLDALRPSHERRLLMSMESNSGREFFIAKLQQYLSQGLSGGETEKDQVTSLATRLSALNVWSKLSQNDMKQLASLSDSSRLVAFLEGLPDKTARALSTVEQIEIGNLDRMEADALRVNSRDSLILKYAEDLNRILGVDPDIELLRKVTISCGVSIYQEKSSIVDVSRIEDLLYVKDHFLSGTLKLPNSWNLMKVIDLALDQNSQIERRLDRVVFYYFLIHQLSNDPTMLRWLAEQPDNIEVAGDWLV